MKIMLIILGIGILLAILVAVTSYLLGWFTVEVENDDDIYIIDPAYQTTTLVDDTSSMVAGAALGGYVAEEIIESTEDSGPGFDGEVVRDTSTEC